MSTLSIRLRVLHRGQCARVSLYRIPLTQTIDGCICNGLMSTEPAKLIGKSLSLQMNQASICEILVSAFMLDAMPGQLCLLQ